MNPPYVSPGKDDDCNKMVDSDDCMTFELAEPAEFVQREADIRESSLGAARDNLPQMLSDIEENPNLEDIASTQKSATPDQTFTKQLTLNSISPSVSVTKAEVKDAGCQTEGVVKIVNEVTLRGTPRLLPRSANLQPLTLVDEFNSADSLVDALEQDINSQELNDYRAEVTRLVNMRNCVCGSMNLSFNEEMRNIED